MFWTVNPPNESGTYKVYNLYNKEMKDIYVNVEDGDMEYGNLWWGPLEKPEEPVVYREKATGALYVYDCGGLISTVHEGLWMGVDPVDLEVEFERV